MLKLRRTLALVVVFIMALGVGVSAATPFPDVTADATYAEAVTILSSLKIFEGDENGNFRPDDTITRAEVVAVILRAQGSGDAAAGAKGVTAFTDVPADHWASGYINVATQLNIVNGFPDKTFKPGDPVTYEQAIKMIVAALGYEPKAKMQGGYPGGYLIIASQERITAGASGKAGEPAKRSVVARLVFNALEVKMLEQTGFNPTAPEYTVSNKTLLYDYLKVAKIDGIVTETSITKATSGGASSSDKDEFTIKVFSTNGINSNSDAFEDAGYEKTEKINTGGINVDAYLGYRVVAYIADFEDSIDERLVAIAPKSGLNNELVISYTQLEPYSSAVGGEIGMPSSGGLILKYRANPSDRNLANINLSYETSSTEDPVYYLNGKAIDETEFVQYVKDVLAEGSTIDSGKLVFVDNNNDGKYDYVSITKINYNIVAKEIDKANMIVEDKNAESVNFDNADNDSWTILYYKADGTPASFDDIKEGDVLSIARSDDQKNGKYECELWQVFIGGEVVEGKVTESTQDSKDRTLYRIGDKYYLVDEENVTVGLEDEGIFYVNFDGKIIQKEAEAGKIGKYAFLQAVGKVNTGVDGGKVQVRYLTAEGKWETRALAKKVTFIKGDEKYNSVETFPATPPADFDDKVFSLYAITVNDSGKSDSVEATDDTPQLIKYSVNAAGEINRIQLAAAYDDSFELIERNEKPYKAASNALGNLSIRDDIIVFNVPDELYSGYEEKDINTFSVGKPAFSDGEKYKFSAYDYDGGYPTVLVIYGSPDTPAADSKVIVVKNVVQRSNADYGQYYSLTGFQAGKEVSADFNPDADFGDDTPDTLKPGDAIIVATDFTGKIIGLEVLFRAAEATAIKDGDLDNDRWEAAFDVYNDDDVDDDVITDIFGFVARKQNGNLYLTSNFVSEFVPANAPGKTATPRVTVPASRSGINFYEVDLMTKSTNKVRPSSFGETNVVLQSGKNGSYAYVRLYEGSVVDVVVYIMEN